MTRFALVVAACAATAAFTAAPARAGYRCDAPQTLFDQSACAAAKQGPTELRRYIQRMRALEPMYFFDYANERDFERWAAEGRVEPQLATRAEAPAQRDAGR
jgi:hypothetical protein